MALVGNSEWLAQTWTMALVNIKKVLIINITKPLYSRGKSSLTQGRDVTAYEVNGQHRYGTE